MEIENRYLYVKTNKGSLLKKFKQTLTNLHFNKKETTEMKSNQYMKSVQRTITQCTNSLVRTDYPKKQRREKGRD